jgi:hypothetical protein
MKKVERDGEEREELVGFRIVSVFDVSQTEGKDLPRGPRDTILHGSSEAAELLLKSIRSVLIRNDLTYAREELEDAYGYYNPLLKRIVTDSRLESNMEARVVTHELVHHFSDMHLSQGDYRVNGAEIEAITESAAYVVLSHFGFDPGEASFNYIAQWGKDVEVVKQKLGDIQKVSSMVIRQIEACVSQREESHAEDSLFAA